MTFYLIGLGLNEESISLEAKKQLGKCEKIFLEIYTSDFPYKVKKLEKILGVKIRKLDREDVESEKFLIEAKKKDIALLVYGDPFSATTHSQLILFCKKNNIKYKIFHNSSIINSIGETGLSIYKFGKICSIPKWKDNYKPTSFIKYIKENKEIKAHSLILIDIGLELKETIHQLEESAKKENFEIPKKIVLVSCLGTKKQKIFYGEIEKIRNKKINKPFCLIIPSEMHYLEEEMLVGLSSLN
ncbi:MAG: diphthine synthase [Candidatus Pacearchaeota archaeon]